MGNDIFSLDPIIYECRIRNILINEAQVTIKLENIFWKILTFLAEQEGISTDEFLTNLYHALPVEQRDRHIFCSFLRFACLFFSPIDNSAFKALSKIDSLGVSFIPASNLN